MQRVTTLGRTFFATALIGLGIEHFVFQAFVTGRAPAWPASVPGGLAWAYLTGIAFIVVGVALLTGTRARVAAVFAAALIFSWALLRHLPVVAVDAFLAPTWTAAGKALTLMGGALAIAASLPPVEASRRTPLSTFINLRREFITVGRLSLGLFMVITGFQHYLYTPFVASLVPAWIPGDGVFWTYLTGVSLIAGGVGLQIPRTAALAALLSGVMVFSWFWIVHIPRTLTSVSDGISVFEALAVSGIAFVLAGHLHEAPAPTGASRPEPVAPQLSGHVQ